MKFLLIILLLLSKVRLCLYKIVIKYLLSPSFYAMYVSMLCMYLLHAAKNT